MLTLGLLGMYFDAVVVFVNSQTLLLKLAVTILCLSIINFSQFGKNLLLPTGFHKIDFVTSLIDLLFLLIDQFNITFAKKKKCVKSDSNVKSPQKLLEKGDLAIFAKCF